MSLPEPHARAQRPGRGVRVLALVTAALTVLAGCTSGDDSDEGAGAEGSRSAQPTRTQPPLEAETLADYENQKLAWRRCAGEFQCADLQVPLDYAKPAGDTINVAVTRLRASGPSDRVGSLVLNPGGPGASGVDYAQAASQVVTEPVRQRFDVVGFDPRGVARSTPVDCLTDEQLDDYLALDATPDDAAEQQDLVRASREFIAGCRERSGRLLGHVSTRDAARDMDVLRAVLGDDKLSYLGKSYGTLLGATYAELFPKRVRVAVLDGAIDPSQPNDEVTLDQAEGFEVALRAFVQDCLRREGCPLSGTVSQGVTQVADLLQRTDSDPLRGDGERQVTQSLAVLGVAAALYDQASGWPALRLGLQSAKGGDGGVLLSIADVYTDREEDGRYRNNRNEVIYAVNCLDRAERQPVSAYASDARSFARRAPVFGPTLAWGALPCSYWPVDAVDRPHEIAAPGSAPILVVGTRRDPATPYASAESLADQLDSGVLLTYEGDGHTAYAQGSACIDRAVENYLITAEPPPPGTVCE